MQIDTAGTYTLKYTAEDACGNITEVEREVVAEQISYRTVLYTDGTFIINEKSTDIDANVAEHGAVTRTYIPWTGVVNTQGDYLWTGLQQQLWANERTLIKNAKVGSRISPRSMAFWFQNCTALESADLTMSSGDNLVHLRYMFAGCSNLKSVVFGVGNTTGLSTIQNMFMGCSAIQNIDLSPIKYEGIIGDFSWIFGNCSSLKTVDISGLKLTSSNTIRSLFVNCSELVTIYTDPTLDLSSANVGTEAFYMAKKIVGGQGSTSSYYGNNKTYARIDGGTSNPGYFTAKPSA